jgi:ribonucleoside-diphosphate reductase alpha chain
LSKGKHEVLNQFDINPDVFKDPFATNMETYIRMTAIRQKYIDQSISLNLFYDLSVTMETLIRHVIIAWKLNIKTFYYMRSQAAMAAADTVREDVCVNCQ